MAMLAVEMLLKKWHKIGDDSKGMELELPQLPWLVPCNRWLPMSLGVQELQQGTEERGVHQSLLSQVVQGVSH